MKVLSISHLLGPNVYHHKAVIVMTLDLEEMKEVHSLMVPGFVDRLLAALPGLSEHFCSPGRVGGFVERLQRGTYFAHIVEHMIIEMTQAIGIPVTYGKSIYESEGVYKVVVKSKSKKGMEALCHAAVELASALVKGEPYPLAEKLEEARRLVGDSELGPSTRAIVEAARKRGIPVARLNEDSLVQLGYGKNRQVIETALTGRTSVIAASIAKDKDLAKRVLAEAFLPVPHGRKVASFEGAIEAFQELGTCVVKPADGNQGKGVTLKVQTLEGMKAAYERALAYSEDVILEELFEGKDYRVLVINGRMVAASERIPASVVGDGARTIAQLVESENQNPLRGEGHEKPLTKIKTDDSTLLYLARCEKSMEYVPQAGERIFLCQTANLSTGGMARDVTSQVHDEVRRLCERAARVVGLDICGIDIILDDISKPPARKRNGIIEVNASPGLRMHLHPSEGEPRDVGGAIVDMLYPSGSSARVPIVSITGTNGKTTVTRMIGHTLQQKSCVGMATTDGIYLGGQKIAQGDMTGPASARLILGDSSVEAAVLETARGGIVKRGLGYDWSDVGIITNVQPDHIGQDGISDLSDILHIKSLVAERVRENGTIVLNADDEELSKLMDNPRVAQVPRQVVYFTLQPHYFKLKRHLDAGGTAYVVEKGSIMELGPQGKLPIVPVAEIPVTFQGAAEFQIANAMAAVAACRALGCSPEEVARGLKTFMADNDNPGRANIYQVGKGFAIADYGHNPNAFQAMGQMVSKWPGRRLTAIVGVPGDRADPLIKLSGSVLAPCFNKFFVREDKDLRGRKPGEGSQLLFQAIREHAGEGVPCRLVPDEGEAFKTAVQEMEDGEIIVTFYEDSTRLKAYLSEAGAVPIPMIPFPTQEAGEAACKQAV